MRRKQKNRNRKFPQTVQRIGKLINRQTICYKFPCGIIIIDSIAIE